MYLLAAALLATQAPSHAAPSQTQQIRLNSGGECEGGQHVDMNKVMFVENRTVEVDGGTGPLRLQLDGETFLSQEIGEHSEGRTYVIRVDTLVRPGEDADIDVKFALVAGRLVIYWRETYQHRGYLFGFVSLEGRALFGDQGRAMTPLCQGRGGSYSVM